MDFPAIIDEIALEGLEGITVEALWKRLEDRPGFVDGQLDDDSKNYIWKLVTRHNELQFFVLPEPRPELVIFKYRSCVRSDSVRCSMPTDIPPDLYSRTAVIDKDVAGCCDHFKTRKNVTGDIRGKEQDTNISLQDALARWGQTLVIVASQRCRNVSLLQSCERSCPAEAYCFLELIGRARHDGEITFCRKRRGLCNPECKAFSLPGNTHTRLNVLESLGVITRQIFITTYNGPNSVHKVRLVHLKRFFSHSNANHRGIVRALNAYLVKSPSRTAPFYDVMRDLDLKPEIVSKVNKRLGNYFSVRNVARKTFFEDDDDANKKNSDNEKFFTGILPEQKVKVITLLKVYRDGDKLGDEDDDLDSEDNDMEEAEDAATGENGEKVSPVVDGYPSVDDSILGQVVTMVYQRGEKGLVASTAKQRLNLSRNNMKHIEKELLKSKVIGTVHRLKRKSRVMAWVRPEIEERLKTKRKDERKAITEKTEKATVSIQAAEISEEMTITPEEEEVIDAKLKEFKFTCTVDKVETKQPPTENDDPRKADRKMFILNTLASKRVFTSKSHVYQDIVSAEKKEGHKQTICRKSVRRILNALYAEGQIEYLNVQLQGSSEVHPMIILPGAGLDDVYIKKAVVELANAKQKFREVDESTDSTHMDSRTPKAMSHSKVTNLGLVSVYNLLISGLNFADRKLKTPIRKHSSNISKMDRTQSLHEYLHYILYGYKGCTDSEPTKTDKLEEIAEPIPVYLDVDDWRRYLPPLHLHNALALRKLRAGPGSCMVGDVMLNMPFGKVWNLVNRAKELRAVLGNFVEDSRLQNVPLCRLPKSILVEIAGRQRFLTRLQEDVTMLCHQGLLSFGPRQRCTNLEFGCFHLHKKAVLVDTRTSLACNLMTRCPEGKSFPTQCYPLDTAEDLAQYWRDLQIFSLNTPLGFKKLTDIPGSHGKVSLFDATKPKLFEEIRESVESDWLPGDGRGAAGMDSSLMVHYTKNWRKGLPHLHASHKLKEELPAVAQEKSGTKKRSAASTTREPLRKKKKVPLNNEKKAAERAKPARRRKRTPPEAIVPTETSPQKPKVKTKGHSKYFHLFDDKDHQAKRVMKRIRSSFTSLENGQLLLCQLAACILNPRLLCVRASLIRDIMHENLPESLDKTTNAVKGKLARLVADHNFNLHLASFLAQAKSDKALMARYSGKLPLQLSPQMAATYRQLVSDLKTKFSSNKRNPDTVLPPTTLELAENYTVMTTLDMLFQSPKLKQPVKTVTDIRTLVVAELVETFLHLERPLGAMQVYFTLSKFTDFEIKEAYNTLRGYNIIVQLKYYELEQKRLLTNTAVLNNHKSKQTHQLALQTWLSKIFHNVSQVMGLLQRPPCRASTAQASGPSTGDTDQVQPRGGRETSSSDGLTENNEVEEREVAKQGDGTGFVSLDVAELQSGASLSILCLAALNRISIDLDIPDETVDLDKAGQRKLGLNREKRYHRPLRGPEGRSIEQVLIRGRRPDSRKGRLGEGYDLVGSRKFSRIDCPLTKNAKMSLLQQQRAEQRHNEKLESPAKPVETAEEEAAEENESQLSSPVPSAGVTASTTASGSAEALTTDTAFPTSEVVCVTASKEGPETVSHNTSGNNEVVALPSIRLRYKNTEGVNSAAGHLPNFVAWVASSCLMTLARTSYINDINLLVADCALSRHFSLVPMKTKFRLETLRKDSSIRKGAASQSALKTPHKAGDSDTSANAATQKHGGNMSTSDELVIIEDTNATVSSVSPHFPRASADDQEHHTGSTGVSQSVASASSKIPSIKAPDTHQQACDSLADLTALKEASFLDLNDLKLYRRLFDRLERCFKPTELNVEVKKAELDALLPVSLQEEGWRLYNVIHLSGKLGIDERDLQVDTDFLLL